MPRGDGTGPRGQGPRTGRGMGRCGGARVEESTVPGRGAGTGLGQGLGRMLRKGLGFGRIRRQGKKES